MTHQEPQGQLLTIGEFGHRTQLTPKALRLYDAQGLLSPATVDPSNGYRYYRTDQVDTARLIGLLRGADMGLTEIAALLTSLRSDRRAAVDALERHDGDLEAQHRSRRILIGHIRTIIQEDEDPMFQIKTRHVGAQRVMSMQRRLHADQTDAFIAEAKAAFAQHLGDVEPVGPFIAVFHGTVDHEHDGPLEALQGCPDSVQPTDLIGVRTEPAHDEAYTTITKAQWAFPAILAAYDAVACSPEAAGRPGSELSCREVYLAEPDEIGEDELICDIAFPLA